LCKRFNGYLHILKQFTKEGDGFSQDILLSNSPQYILQLSGPKFEPAPCQNEFASKPATTNKLK
jgi:hypothetical protein